MGNATTRRVLGQWLRCAGRVEGGARRVVERIGFLTPRVRRSARTTMPPRRLQPTGGWLMSTTHKEEHSEQAQPARPTRPSQVQLCCSPTLLQTASRREPRQCPHRVARRDALGEMGNPVATADTVAGEDRSGMPSTLALQEHSCGALSRMFGSMRRTVSTCRNSAPAGRTWSLPANSASTSRSSWGRPREDGIECVRNLLQRLQIDPAQRDRWS
jgi:hypothetical protein